MTNRKEEMKLKKLEKKDGPLTWEELTEQAFQSLMKSESQYSPKENKISSTPKLEQINTRKTSNYSDTAATPTQSDNTRSKTFRTVSPNEDTTVNTQGQKYSKIFKINNNNQNVKTGFMGRSRLTRL